MYHSKSKFRIIDRDYEVIRTIISYSSLLKITIYPILKGQIGNSFKDQTRPPIGDDSIWPSYKTVEFVIIDEVGQIVPYYRIWEDAGSPRLTAYEAANRPKYRRGTSGSFEFRNGPVPGVHKFKKSNWGRKQRFMQEWRASVEDREYIRPKRRKGILSQNYMLNFWDESVRSDAFIKHSWKKQKKKKQWQ